MTLRGMNSRYIRRWILVAVVHVIMAAAPGLLLEARAQSASVRGFVTADPGGESLQGVNVCG